MEFANMAEKSRSRSAHAFFKYTLKQDSRQTEGLIGTVENKKRTRLQIDAW